VNEVRPDREESIELKGDVGAPRSFYGDTLWNLDVGTSYKQRELYQMFG